MSIVEVIIGLVILVMLSQSAIVVSQSTTSASRANMLVAELETEANRTMEDVCSKIRHASFASLAPANVVTPFSTTAITFQRVTGYGGAAPILSSAQSIQFESSLQDPNDGIDNDGDGLVDEGRITWTSDIGLASERTIVLTNWVRESLNNEVDGNGIDDNGNGLIDEGGFCIEYEGNVLVIRVTLERVSTRGERIARTVERRLRLRNEG